MTGVMRKGANVGQQDEGEPKVSVSEAAVRAREASLARVAAHLDAGAEFLPAGQRDGGLEPGEPVYEGHLSDMKQFVGIPLRKADALTAMHARRTISNEMLAAGRRFQKAFEDFHAGDVGAVDWLKCGRAGWKEPDFMRLSRGRELCEAMAALGGRGAPPGSACWYVLGEGLSIKQWAQHHQPRGRVMDVKMASGVLLGALSILVGLWNIEARAGRRSAR